MTPTPSPTPDDLERVYDRPRPAWTVGFLLGMLVLYMVTYVLVVTYGDQLAYPLGGRPQPFPAIPIPAPGTPPPAPPPIDPALIKRTLAVIPIVFYLGGYFGGLEFFRRRYGRAEFRGHEATFHLALTIGEASVQTRDLREVESRRVTPAGVLLRWAGPWWGTRQTFLVPASEEQLPEVIAYLDEHQLSRLAAEEERAPSE